MTVDAAIEHARGALTASFVRQIAGAMTCITSEGYEFDDSFIARNMDAFIKWRERHLADLRSELASFQSDVANPDSGD